MKCLVRMVERISVSSGVEEGSKVGTPSMVRKSMDGRVEVVGTSLLSGGGGEGAVRMAGFCLDGALEAESTAGAD
jgi:hypothetical protein